MVLWYEKYNFRKCVAALILTTVFLHKKCLEYEIILVKLGLFFPHNMNLYKFKNLGTDWLTSSSYLLWIDRPQLPGCLSQ